MRVGRPTKLTAEFLAAASSVLSNAANLLYTDNDLLEAINAHLPACRHVAPRTFQTWKADSSKGKFQRLIKEAERQQKLALFQALTTAPAGWQRWAWLLERKFPQQWRR